MNAIPQNWTDFYGSSRKTGGTACCISPILETFFKRDQKILKMTICFPSSFGKREVFVLTIDDAMESVLHCLMDTVNQCTAKKGINTAKQCSCPLIDKTAMRYVGYAA